jgi:DNA (cytosine-5)-methyltransferase 1
MMTKTRQKALRAIDLYSGVGGWALGLRLAGIEVVASYERWGIANETNFKNNHHQAQTVDIRRLELADLPTDIDIVVGSPPCTQFSFSNRGGSGDLADGLKDVIQFLSIVEHLKPKVWAMENVPRMAKIIEAELQKGGVLHRFSSLGVQTHIVNTADYGVPQRRMRCIAGNFDFALLQSYRATSIPLTLGDVVDSLAAKVVRDPIYGMTLPQSELRDHVEETPLGEEEVRINRAAKTTHTVYNAMSFPDQLNRPVRTITATCTRVSRESIVIATADTPTLFRRLTIRERASLQGFPITFQFYTEVYGHKQQMVGNAIPPAFTYYLAHALLETPVDAVPPLFEVGKDLTCPSPPATDAMPNRAGSKYAEGRRFRFAIPSLQLKSGVRFELVNRVASQPITWGVDFYFGTSKSIISLDLSEGLQSRVLALFPTALIKRVAGALEGLHDFLKTADLDGMQRIWSRRGLGITTPFMLLDQLDATGSSLTSVLADDEHFAKWVLGMVINLEYGQDEGRYLPGLGKLANNASLVVAGLLVGSTTNAYLTHPRANARNQLQLVA